MDGQQLIESAGESHPGCLVELKKKDRRFRDRRSEIAIQTGKIMDGCWGSVRQDDLIDYVNDAIAGHYIDCGNRCAINRDDVISGANLNILSIHRGS